MEPERVNSKVSTAICWVRNSYKSTVFFSMLVLLSLKYWRNRTMQESQRKTFSQPTLVLPFEMEYNDTAYKSAAAARLPKNGSVFCWISTSPRYHNSRVLAVNETWLPRCDHGEFFSTERMKDESIPYSTVFKDMDDGYDLLFLKTRKAFHHLHTVYSNNFDWYLKADDDTYIFWENLKAYLDTLNPDKPYFLGHPFKPFLKKGYNSGGAGYVLSRAALKLLVEQAFPNQTICPFEKFEDVAISRCLANVGVIPEDTRNANGQHRFNPLNPKVLFNRNEDNPEYTIWPWKRHYKVFAPELISLHYVPPDEMRIYDVIRYRIPKNYTNMNNTSIQH